jgi:hypothetical protein
MRNPLRIVSFLILLLSLFSVGSQAQTIPFSEKDFLKIKDLVCDTQTLEDLKVIGKTCELDSFTIRAEDLNGDGKQEWFFFGPSGECGAHGNCPVKIFTKDGGNFTLLNKDCQGERCLAWGNEYGSLVLKNSHQGFRDLQIAGDSGSFFWTKNIYQWDGHAYQLLQGSTTYYLYDADSERLKQVTQKRYEACVKTGKGCP